MAVAVEQRGRDAAQADVDVLVDERVAEPPGRGDLVAERGQFGDGVGGEAAEVVRGDPGVELRAIERRQDREAGRHHVRRRARARVEADRHDARRVAALEVDDLVAVEHAEIGRLARLHRQPLQERPHQPRQARGLQVALAEPQDGRQQPVVLAVGVGVAVVHQAHEIAARGGARQAGQRAGLGGRQARVVVREQLDDAQALAQALDQQRAVDVLAGGHAQVKP